MKEKINLKGLVRSLEKKYGDCELMGLISPFMLEALNAERRFVLTGKPEHPTAFSDIGRSVRLGYETDPDRICEVMGRNDMTYSELSHFYTYAVINALIVLNLSPVSDALLAKTAEYLKKLDRLPAESLYRRLSEAERILEGSEYFSGCDATTKNAVRDQVRRTAKKHSLSESEAARLFLTRDPFEQKSTLRSRLYFPVLAALFVVMTLTVLLLIGEPLLIFFLLLPLSESAKQLTDGIFSRTVKTRPIPKKKLSDVPDDAVTLTVITALLDGGKGDAELVRRLRSCAFANRHKNAHFGLLCDLKESDVRVRPSDGDAIASVAEEIDRIREKYGISLYLFVRERRFAPSEGKYMGWERKRGAVIELTRLIKGQKTTIDVVRGGGDVLKNVRYVVTLDSDTRLYTGAVTDMLGAMLHPSNRPVIRDGRVVKGYGILQPRMEPTLSSAEKTPFAVLSAGNGGTDIYATASYETYQSVFGEGIFCGKGIFDVDAFSEVIDGRFPDGTVLSHDLIEGCYLRAGALTDISLTDDLPKSPLSCFERSHRWLRGDLQALSFIGNQYTNGEGKLISSALTPLSKFKLMDNLRRGLVPISATLALLLWVIGHRSMSPFVLISALSYLAVPFIITALSSLRHSGKRFFSCLIPELLSAAANLLYATASLIHTAQNNLDALLRSGYRLLFSRKKLLQWRTASDSDRSVKGLPLYLMKMSSSVISGVILMLLPSLTLKLLGLLFFLFPFAAFLIGRPVSKRKRPSPAKLERIRAYGEDIWRFFDENVGEADNHLPPDNLQLSPERRIAHRTSPTNIGLYLISCFGAYKLGYITQNEALSRISSTLKTVSQLPKWKGHLYNWYDTVNLCILGQPYVSTVDSGNFICCLIALKQCLEGDELPSYHSSLPDSLEGLISGAQLSALYDGEQKLFVIGINTDSGKTDGLYDLYASEFRTTSFFAIASSQVPREHWTALRRPIVTSGGYLGLSSWTGTMFEYLMPSLLLRSRPMSLGYEALSFAVFEQRRDTADGIWGQSESGYFNFDSELNYQYKAFGVPSLALKRGVERDRVISPYSTFLALPFCPDAALLNLKKLRSKGMYGPYGFYEAYDMTPSRVGSGGAIIRSYMSHHMGMSLAAVANLCLDGLFVEAFMSDPRCESAEDLTEEKVPIRATAVKQKKIKHDPPAPIQTTRFSPDGGRAETDAAAMLSENGVRVLASSDMLRLSCHRDEVSVDPFAFGRIYRPRFVFRADGVIHDALDGKMTASPDGGLISWELERSRLSSRLELSLIGSCSAFVFSLSVTGEFERICPMLAFIPSMSSSSDRASHPSYSDLLLTTEYDRGSGALIYVRAMKDGGEKCLAVSFESGGEAEYLTERTPLGRGYTDTDVEALTDARFECKNGTPVDPFCAVKKTSEARGKYLCTVLIVASDSKSGAIVNLKKARAALKSIKGHSPAEAVSRLMRRSVLERLATVRTDGFFYPVLRSTLDAVIHPSPSLPKSSSCIDALFRHGISGDNPMIVLRLSEDTVTPSVRGLVRAFVSSHKYLALSSVKLDTVFIFKDGGEYVNVHRELIKSTAEECGCGYLLGNSGGIFTVPEGKDTELFCGIASFFLELTSDFTADKLHRHNEKGPRTVPVTAVSGESENAEGLSVLSGVFTEKGFTVRKTELPESHPPLSFVYSGGHFGTLVTDNSLGYTWIGNCHERRISEYLPDRLLSLRGERLIGRISDVEYDLIACAHTARFTFSHAEWTGELEGVKYRITAGVDPKLPCKVIAVCPKGTMTVEMRVIPVLGDVPRINRPVRTVTDGGLTRFLPTLCGPHPDEAFLYRSEDENGVCFVLGAHPLGAVRVREHIINKYSSAKAADLCYGEYERFIDSLTPKLELSVEADPYLSVMTEKYLPYQALVCRFFARTGFYQSGGAYGFRDQLQDCLCIMLSAPHIARAHILRCACHQYEEGDVMHWWHSIRGKSRGVRTRYSDDLLWLPYTVAKYISFTSDNDILDVRLPYITSPVLSDTEIDRYEPARRSEYSESLYFHCVRAIEHALELGKTGLPLMKGGDWNDGMNRVEGESVWLGLFLSALLRDFAPIAASMGDVSGANRYRGLSTELLESCDRHFDGEKYKRAYYSDGSPVGGENFIDLIPQAFSVFAGASQNRSKTALKTAFNTLFDAENRTFSLLHPPFSKKRGDDPGYISSYPEGMRENGGQYTHAAAWGIMAMAEVGMTEEAWQIASSIDPARICADACCGHKYLGEPYFIAGDVSTSSDHGGLCGWSIYTGSAGWFFNAVFATLLGIRITGDCFTVDPKLSSEHPSYRLTFTHSDTLYTVNVCSGQRKSYILDGREVNNLFYFDKNRHYLEITVEISKEMQ